MSPNTISRGRIAAALASATPREVWPAAICPGARSRAATWGRRRRRRLAGSLSLFVRLEPPGAPGKWKRRGHGEHRRPAST